MNFISHHEVARQYDPSKGPDFLFGSFVSDFGRMAGNRRALTGAINPELLAGLEFHKRTNKPAFDDQLEVMELEAGLRRSLDEFLPWRTATQASRAGKDLLFDGIQFTEARIVADFLDTLSHVLKGDVDLTGAEAPESLLYVALRIYNEGPPRYDEVEVVAQRLYDVLGNTRTPLEYGDFSKVSGVLSLHQPTVFNIGPTAMRQTVATLHEINMLGNI